MKNNIICCFGSPCSCVKGVAKSNPIIKKKVWKFKINHLLLSLTFTPSSCVKSDTITGDVASLTFSHCPEQAALPNQTLTKKFGKKRKNTL